MNINDTTASYKSATPAPLAMATDRLLIFGGPYSNLAATRAMLEEAERLGFTADEILCTGDVVAYCGEPAETLDLIRASGIPVVMGNCEESLAQEKDDCGCGFDAGSQCDMLSVQWYEFASAQINQDHRQWMAGLPRQIIVEIGGRKLLATHAGFSSINEFIFASSPAENKLAQMASAGVDGMITGHSGIPFMQELSGKFWLNAGAIGMPANDGTDRMWYAILENQNNNIDVSIHALTYDASSSQKIMHDRGLVSGYQECLSTGLWPSVDVLPKTERKQTGIALVERQLNWSCVT